MPAPNVDKDLTKQLQAAKKKPRNFVVIAKGATVLKLIVDKKPIKPDVVREAKSESGGTAIARGVVQGDGGPELVFRVAEAPSFGEVKLRAYVTEATKLTLKTTIQVVPDVQEIDDSSEDEAEATETQSEDVSPQRPVTNEPQGESQNPSVSTPPSPPRQPPPEQRQATKRLAALKSDLDKVKSAKTSVSEKVAKVLEGLMRRLEGRQFDQALEWLDQLERLVAAGIKELDDEGRRRGDAEVEFKDRLKEVMSDLKDQAGTPLAERARLKASEAGVAARKGNYPLAIELLIEADDILDEDTEYFDALSGDEEEDEDEEEFFDVEEWDESEEADRQRQEQADRERRSEAVAALIDQIATELRGFETLGGVPPNVPASTQFADVEFASEEEFVQAERQLQGELRTVREALEREKLAAEERRLARERAVAIQKRIAALDEQQKTLVECYEGNRVETRCADTYRGRDALTSQEHEDALQRLTGEESAVAEQLRRQIEAIEQRDAKAAQEIFESQQRAKRVVRKIFEVMDARKRLENAGTDLDFALPEWNTYDEVGAVELSENEANDALNRANEESARLLARIDVLVKNAKWRPGELVDLEGDAATARDSLVRALGENEALDENAAVGWVETLNAAAKERRETLRREMVRAAMEEFYDGRNPNPTVKPQKNTLDLMEEFAKEYELPAAKPQLNEYKKVYSQITQERVAKQEPPRNGILALTKLRSALPSGTTGGQWYTHDQSIKDGDLTFEFHLSVAFRTTLGKKNAPDVATITKAHVSFKTGGIDYKYWYKIAKGKFTFENTSGGAPRDGRLRDAANRLLASKVKSLNCTT